MANIWVYTSGFRSCEMAFGLQNFRTTWCSCLQTAITSSFQLRFAHRLKRWTSNFPIFEKKRNGIQEVLEICPTVVVLLNFLMLDFSHFPPCIFYWLWQRTTKLQSLNSPCKWASIFFAMDYIEPSLILDCFGDQKAIWLEVIARVLNMPIELKGNNYYSEVGAFYINKNGFGNI